MSDAVLIAAIGVVPSIVGTISIILLAKINRKAEDAVKQRATIAHDVAAKVDEAANIASTQREHDKRTQLAATQYTIEQLKMLKSVTDATKKTGDVTHALVNSEHEATMLLLAETLEWKAASTKRPEDQMAAVAARKKYQEHVAAQAKSVANIHD